jgi:seryl-tRNA synthetase
MLDLAFVRDHLPLVQDRLRQRGIDPISTLRDFEAIDADRRAAITEAETMKARRNQLTAEFQLLRKNQQDTTANLAEQRELKEKLPKADERVAAIDAKLREILTNIPNLPHQSVPVGKDEHDNVELRRWGSPPQFDFAPKPHWELGEQLGVLDLERAAKITGARFAVYWDLGAKLERALINFMLDLHTREHGYTEVLPPSLVNPESMYSTGQLPKFEADSFKVPTDRFEKSRYRTPRVGELVGVEGHDGGPFRVVGLYDNGFIAGIRPADGLGPEERVPRTALLYQRDLYLIPTAEVPVTNLYRDETIEAARLPIALAAYTPCFRSEAGSYGKDVRGIIRQHQFQKVELVKFTRPEQSWDEHEKLTRDAEQVLQKLGLHYRTVALCTGDLGFASAKTYDIEVWLPGQGLFREISSCSNFTDFQARRANIRYRSEGAKKSELLHTLNGSGLAVGRTWVAIVENCQQADGSVIIPEALRPYLGADRITPRKL